MIVVHDQIKSLNIKIYDPMNQREIIFRGITASNEWVEGDLIQDGDNKYIFPTSSGFFEFSYSIKQVKPESVSMFTGLFDKNGKRVFGLDVVFNSNKTLLTLPEDPRTYLVKWVEPSYDKDNTWLQKKPSFEFEKIKANGKNYMSLIFNQSQIEVIGNVLQNPELLQP